MKQPSHVALVDNAGIQIPITAESLLSGCFYRASPVGTAEHLLFSKPDGFEKNSVIFPISLENEDIWNMTLDQIELSPRNSCFTS